MQQIILNDRENLMPLRDRNEISLNLFQRQPWEIFGTFIYPNEVSPSMANKDYKDWMREIAISEKIQIASKYVVAKKTKFSPPHIHGLIFGYYQNWICLEGRGRLDGWENIITWENMGSTNRQLDIIGGHDSYVNRCNYLAEHLVQSNKANSSIYMWYNQSLLNRTDFKNNQQVKQCYELRQCQHDLMPPDTHWERRIMRSLGDHY